jgi:hypothetical protein
VRAQASAIPQGDKKQAKPPAEVTMWPSRLPRRRERQTRVSKEILIMTMRRMPSAGHLGTALWFLILVFNAPSAHAQNPKPGSAPVNIVSPLPLPVNVVAPSPLPVTVTATAASTERISFQGLVSLETGVPSTETTSPSYTVADGKVLVIENVQYDTNGACFYKYIPTLVVDRPFESGVRFDRYDLAVVSPDAFATGGGAFVSAATHALKINAPPTATIRFGFRRNATNCFGQIRFQVDGHLESVQ